MRRRVRQRPGGEPPAELKDFDLWAANRGLPSEYTPAIGSAAAQAWERWADERDAWVAAHGPAGEDLLGPMPPGGARWDPEVIGPINPATHDVWYYPDVSV